MKSLWSRPIGTGMSSTVLLLCLSAVIALAACGEEQAVPTADTPVTVGPTAESALSATSSAAAEPQPTAAASTPGPTPTAPPISTPSTTTQLTNTPAPTHPPTATPVAGPASTSTPAPALSAESVGVSRDCTGDRDALVELYNSTGGDNWWRKDNWLSDHTVGSWFGVNASSDGCVTTLSLHNNQLSGEIPPQLTRLASLEGLYLYGNQLTGEIPPELGSLVGLKS